MPSPSTSTSSEALAAAAERRHSQQPHLSSAAQLAEEHEQRQAFRRLINPGIMRPNSKEVAFSSLQTLSTLAENILREPDNIKFHQFKPTNSMIKRTLVDPKGALEYAVALGFHAQVKNFQPYYVFNPKHMEDLRIGAAILKEALDLENEKRERAQRSKQEEKAAADAVLNKVKLAFMDDRKSKLLQDEREKEVREARAAAALAAKHNTERTEDLVPPSPSMPGSAHVLGIEMDRSLPDDDDDSYEH